MCHVQTRTRMAGSILLIMHRYPKQSSHYIITSNFMKEQFSILSVTFWTHSADIFVTCLSNSTTFKVGRTKLCHFTNQHIADLTVQKNPVKFVAT